MKVAILGATGAVGRMMLRILDERNFPVDELVLLASERSRGQKVRWRDRDYTVRVPEAGVFDGCGIALFSAGAARSREWGLRATDEGATVIDNSSAWRMHPDVPLVVPEVNGARARNPKRGIIANPNCATIQLVIALEAVRRAGGLRRVVSTTFQSVSGAGQKGIDALAAELAGGKSANSPFTAQIAGNVIPFIGPRNSDGWNEEEDKIRNETRKILELPELAVMATCVRVPVAIGHCVAAMVQMERPLSPNQVRAAFAAMPGLQLTPDGTDPLPRDVAGTDIVRVGRVRSDPDFPEVLHLWVVADNLRKGAATNAVQIAEQLLRD
jgi:aspartate-semialdehyde dehydrogenase